MKDRTTNRHLDANIYAEEIEKLYRQFELLTGRINILFWWTLYEPLSQWEFETYLVGFSYFHFLNSDQSVFYDWLAPGWGTNVNYNIDGEPNWEDPNAFPYDEGDQMYFHMYLYMDPPDSIPDQPGKIDETAAGVGTGWTKEDVVAWKIEDQDGEEYVFVNSNLGLKYIDLYGDTNSGSYLMFHLQPHTGSNQDDPLLSEAEYRANIAEMARFGKKASEGNVTSLKIYYRLQSDIL